MASNLELVRARGSTRERLIVALDIDGLEQAQELVRLLAGDVGMFKVGKQLFTHAGPQAVRLIQELGGEIFLDLKFHDIPNTVAKAAIEATRMGVKMFNVHASGSLDMMRLTVKEVERVCRQEKRRKPIMLAVTVLTSLNQDDLRRVGVDANVEDQVVRLALLTKEAGMDGVVASSHEVAHIRDACGRRFIIVTPGIRPADASRNDQQRVMTPAEAIRAGVDYIVVGRPILEAENPLSAARAIVADMQTRREASVRHSPHENSRSR
jgi:orotidine-5'-phosphate decarboxylase